MIPIVDDLLDYAVTVRETLLDAGLRVEIDTSDNRLNAKVRAAVIRKVPLVLLLGRREQENESVSVRYRSGKEQSMSLGAFVTHAQELVSSKSLEGADHLWQVTQ